jgi:hypothetical protein
VPQSKLQKRIGRLDDQDILRLNQAILVFLGLTVSAARETDGMNRSAYIRFAQSKGLN